MGGGVLLLVSSNEDFTSPLYIFKLFQKGPGEKTQSVKCLPRKHGDLSSIPIAHVKKSSVFVIPELGVMRAGQLELTGLPA